MSSMVTRTCQCALSVDITGPELNPIFLLSFLSVIGASLSKPLHSCVLKMSICVLLKVCLLLPPHGTGSSHCVVECCAITWRSWVQASQRQLLSFLFWCGKHTRVNANVNIQSMGTHKRKQTKKTSVTFSITPIEHFRAFKAHLEYSGGPGSHLSWSCSYSSQTLPLSSPRPLLLQINNPATVATSILLTHILLVHEAVIGVYWFQKWVFFSGHSGEKVSPSQHT